MTDKQNPARQTKAEDEHRCPICDEAFKPDDNCATDIELGTCHFDCLDGSPVVDLETGEEIPDDDMHTFPYSDVMDPPPPAHVRGDLGITKEWFERRAKAEADLEIGAGFSVVNVTDADVAQMEVLAERALPEWAQAELARLRAIALDMQKGYIGLKDLVERAQSIISTSTYPREARHEM